jgi:hypothetical protein
MIGNDAVSSAGASRQRTKDRPAEGAVLWFGEPQLPAPRYCWSTEADPSLRLESSIAIGGRPGTDRPEFDSRAGLQARQRFLLTLRPADIASREASGVGDEEVDGNKWCHRCQIRWSRRPLSDQHRPRRRTSVLLAILFLPYFGCWIRVIVLNKFPLSTHQ